MNETLETKCGWRILRRILITLAVLATLVAAFYAEEDWRGKRAWERCKHELEAKGYILDWNKYIPPSVPDGQNIFKAPQMTDWFVGKGQSELTKRLQSSNLNLTTSIGASNLIVTVGMATDYLSWSDQFEPDFHLIREALQRPYARMDGDYSQPYGIPIPNFITVRAVAQTLAQRAHCYFILNKPDRALEELTLIHDLSNLLQPPPSGRPITLVAAMINVAVAGLYANTVAEGFRKNAWQDSQLVLLQKQLAGADLMPRVLEALETEPVASCDMIETIPVFKIFNFSEHPNWGWKDKLGSWLFPRGWIYQNMVNIMTIQHKSLSGFDAERKVVSPKTFDRIFRETEKFLAHKTPYNIVAEIAVPNFAKAWQVTARNQAAVNEAQIACALERYRLTNGEYPEKLGALVPQFMEKLPHDLIGGQPLHYRRTEDGKFLLYSIGWNETDDDGQVSEDRTKGDWVWQYPAK